MNTSDNYRQIHVKFVPLRKYYLMLKGFYLSVINKLGSKEEFLLTLLL